MAWSVYPDLNAGGGPCEFCGDQVKGGHGPEVSVGSGGGGWRRIYYHVSCRKRHERETWHQEYDQMTLDEAVGWFREAGGYACACMGPPNGAPLGAGCHCALVSDQAKRLQAGAWVARDLMAQRAAKLVDTAWPPPDLRGTAGATPGNPTRNKANPS